MKQFLTTAGLLLILSSCSYVPTEPPNYPDPDAKSPVKRITEYTYDVRFSKDSYEPIWSSEHLSEIALYNRQGHLTEKISPGPGNDNHLIPDLHRWVKRNRNGQIEKDSIYLRQRPDDPYALGTNNGKPYARVEKNNYNEDDYLTYHSTKTYGLDYSAYGEGDYLLEDTYEYDQKNNLIKTTSYVNWATDSYRMYKYYPNNLIQSEKWYNGNNTIVRHFKYFYYFGRSREVELIYDDDGSLLSKTISRTDRNGSTIYIRTNEMDGTPTIEKGRMEYDHKGRWVLSEWVPGIEYSKREFDSHGYLSLREHYRDGTLNNSDEYMRREDGAILKEVTIRQGFLGFEKTTKVYELDPFGNYTSLLKFNNRNEGYLVTRDIQYY